MVWVCVFVGSLGCCYVFWKICSVYRPAHAILVLFTLSINKSSGEPVQVASLKKTKN